MIGRILFRSNQNYIQAEGIYSCKNRILFSIVWWQLSDPAVPDRFADQFACVCEVFLMKHILAVRINCLFADVEDACDLFTEFPLDQ